MVERKGDIPNLSFRRLADDKTPRCPSCGARNPHGTACQKPKR